MIEEIAGPEAYLICVWIKDIHPLLWRRFLVRGDSTLADLHEVLQTGFGWTDFHLHRFRIRKKDYAVPRACGALANDAREVRLAEFSFRHNGLPGLFLHFSYGKTVSPLMPRFPEAENFPQRGTDTSILKELAATRMRLGR